MNFNVYRRGRRGYRGTGGGGTGGREKMGWLGRGKEIGTQRKLGKFCTLWRQGAGVLREWEEEAYIVFHSCMQKLVVT